jgi:hypothetical protein
MTLDAVDNGRPRLAQELLDLALDHVFHDSETLKKCALASKSLVPTCQRHLFSRYHISKSNVHKLVKLFTPCKDDDDEKTLLRASITDLMNTYTTDLTFTADPDCEFNLAVSLHLPRTYRRSPSRANRLMYS